MALCWTKLTPILILFSTTLVASPTGNASVQRMPIQALLNRKKALNSEHKSEKIVKPYVVKQTPIVKKPAEIQTPKTVVKYIEKPQKQNESSFVEPTGTELPELVTVPIQTVFRVKSLDEISNLNYQQDAVFALLNDGGNPKLKDARLLGTYKVYAQQKNRMYVDFHTIILNDGSEFKISGYAVDVTDQKAGILAIVDDHTGANILKILGETASAIVSAATYQQSGGAVGKIIDKTAGASLNNLEIENLVTVQKDTVSLLKLSRQFSFPKY